MRGRCRYKSGGQYNAGAHMAGARRGCKTGTRRGWLAAYRRSSCGGQLLAAAWEERAPWLGITVAGQRVGSLYTAICRQEAGVARQQRHNSRGAGAGWAPGGAAPCSLPCQQTFSEHAPHKGGQPARRGTCLHLDGLVRRVPLQLKIPELKGVDVLLVCRCWHVRESNLRACGVAGDGLLVHSCSACSVASTP